MLKNRQHAWKGTRDGKIAVLGFVVFKQSFSSSSKVQTFPTFSVLGGRYTRFCMKGGCYE